MNLCEKLAAIQAALKAPKTQENKFGGYKYRKAEDILEAVKPLLSQFKCALICTDELVQVHDRIYVKATARLLDTEKNDQLETTAYAREEQDKKGMDQSQVTGASSSYARKYALNGLLCIDDTADSDTTNVGDGKPAPQKPVKKATAPKPEAAAPAPAPAPEPKKELTPREKWVKALAEKAVNKQGITAEAAYKAMFHPTEEDWNALMDEVFRYQLAHGISD